MEKSEINPDPLTIVPFDRSMVKGAFPEPDEDNTHLVSWFQTMSVHSQEERKCKIYVAMTGGKVIGYLAMSMALPDEPIEGLSDTTDHAPQMVLVGKLYVAPAKRNAGTGRKLMDFALDIAIEIDELIGCIGIIADANNNPDTVRFYTKYGFEIINETKRTVKVFFKIPERPVLPVQD